MAAIVADDPVAESTDWVGVFELVLPFVTLAAGAAVGFWLAVKRDRRQRRMDLLAGLLDQLAELKGTTPVDIDGFVVRYSQLNREAEQLRLDFQARMNQLLWRLDAAGVASRDELARLHARLFEQVWAATDGYAPQNVPSPSFYSRWVQAGVTAAKQSHIDLLEAFREIEQAASKEVRLLVESSKGA